METDRSTPQIPCTTSTRLILFAHGSRDPRWRQPFDQLLASARKRLGTDAVELAYMEMCAPSLLDAAERASAAGVQKLVVLPLFMSAGSHVANDIPRLVDHAMTAYEGLSIQVLPPVGEHPDVIAGLLSIMEQSLAQPSQRA